MRYYVYAVIGLILFSMQGVLVKLCREHVHPMTLIFYKVLFATIMVVLVVPRLDSGVFRVDRYILKRYATVGFILAVCMVLYTTAYVFAPVSNVILLVYLYPFITLVLAWLFLRERITMPRVVTLGLALIAIGVLNPFKAGPYVLGNILALLFAFFYAYLIIRYRHEAQSIGPVLWYFIFAFLLVLPFPFIFGFGDVGKILGYLVILGAIATGGAHLFTNLALQKVESSLYCILDSVLSPLITILLAVLIISEPISWSILIAGALLIGAGTYLRWRERIAY